MIKMTKYTTTSLIEVLKKFPKDLPIETELAFMWNFPEELREGIKDINSEEFQESTMKNATDLCIFEGDWETGISDVNGKFEEFRKKR